MSRFAIWLPLLFTGSLLASLGLMSYFGAPNPVALGLQSSLGIALAVIAVASGLYFVPVRLAVGLFSLLLLFCLFLTAANWWHYQFFRVYFNYEFLAFARDSGEAIRSIAEFSYKWELALLTLVLLLSGVLFYYLRRSYIKAHIMAAQGVVCAFTALVLFGMVSDKIETLRRANAFTLSPYFLHPVHAFFYPLSDRVEGDFEDWLAYKQKNTIQEPEAFLPKDVEQEKLNIIVVTMESFRASFVGAYNPQSHLTPNFDRIVESGVLFRNFYANSNYTVKGENALICGIFDHNAKISIAEFPAQKNLNCLPKILAGEGYSSYYFHGNHGEFYNRQNYLAEVGFEHTYFHADKVPNKDDGHTYIGWGLADADLFSLGLKSLEEIGDQAFYAHFMSLSNHYPFKFEWPITVPYDLNSFSGNAEEKIYAAHKNAIRYSDYALGKFWQKFRASKLYSNTIVVITADHGVWSFDKSSYGSDARLNEKFFRIPLFVYHPKIKRSFQVSQVSSQVDVPVTLLELVGAEFSGDDFIGKNLFAKVAEPWAVMMKGGEVSVRVSHRLCLPDRPACAGPYQSCWADTGVADFLDNLGGSKCYAYSGDPLNGGAFTEIDSGPKVLSSALGVISFENRRVFADATAADKLNPSHPSLDEFNRNLREKAVGTVSIDSKALPEEG